MSEIYGGNMVFPINNTGHGEPFDEGMSLRDYCAIQAMNGFLSGQKFLDAKSLAQRAYEYADAMMDQR